MRILCVCLAGVVRSVCAAWHFKALGHDALACGIHYNEPDTIEMLSAWADRIVVMQPEYADAIPKQFSNKIKVLDVGPDTVGPQFSDELRMKIVDNIDSILK